ncbi:hypothetical protein ACED51_17060 [Photobacterium swingsii]|uniref:hypothetical protein n=1 Tax=Photobacterium swingsii TaxID=680026 RepID=UPI00352E36F6
MAIQPARIERDKYGFWTHPEFPNFGEVITKEEKERWEKANNVKLEFIYFEQDAPEVLQERYFTEGQAKACAEWEPSQPKSSFLISVHDTEDGPIAFFAVSYQPED